MLYLVTKWPIIICYSTTYMYLLIMVVIDRLLFVELIISDKSYFRMRYCKVMGVILDQSFYLLSESGEFSLAHVIDFRRYLLSYLTKTCMYNFFNHRYHLLEINENVQFNHLVLPNCTGDFPTF